MRDATRFSHQERIAYFRQFSTHSQHFTALQPDMQYFDVPGKGYLAYQVYLNRAMVLGDPVARLDHQPEIISQFLRHHKKPTFVQVSQHLAEFLHQTNGYFATQFGMELKVPIADWSVSGKSRKGIRKAINQADTQGIEVHEESAELNVDQVCQQWLGTRKTKREIRYLIRPRKMQPDPRTRFFYACKNGRPIGFAYFDPQYEDGQVVGYLPNISRGCESFRQGLFYTLMVHAIDVFRSEGVSHIDLGLCPLALHDDPLPYESKTARRIFHWTYRNCFHYNCKGIHFTKQRFGNDWKRTFLCHTHAAPLIDMWRLLRLTRIF